MLTYKLSNKNLAVRLINLFTDSPPRSLCTFFWTFLLVVGLFPINLLGLLIYKVFLVNEFNKDLLLIPLMGLLGLLVSFLGGVFIGYLIVHPLETLLILAGTCLFYYIVWLFIDNDHEVIKDGFRSVKNKTCPKIEYID